MSDEVEPKRHRKKGWGGKRKGSGRKPLGIKTEQLTLYLREHEADAARFLALDRGQSISRCVIDIMMEAYRERVRTIIKS